MAGRLQIDRTYLTQMARSPDFYLAVPEFLYLREVAMKSWEMYQQSGDCVRCHNEWRFMRGVCDAIFMKLREWKEQNDPALQSVKTWLAKRKGYPVNHVVLYYRRSKTQKKIAKLEF